MILGSLMRLVARDEKMRLHLVAGFLGSGKTTAIIGACKLLMAQGQRVGVVTNDQGKYLVDTAFVRLADIPAVEVSGGCFCCHYDDLHARLAMLRDEVHPDAIFAESVGSCADVVATVIRPLLTLSDSPAQPTSFSVFADARLLHRRLLGMPMPFSDSIVYLFDRQIEEAGLLVINKIDLLTPEQAAEVEQLAQRRFPGKRLRRQNSLAAKSIAEWVELIDQGAPVMPARDNEIDYERYGEGESRLAWLDQEVRWTVREGQGRPVVIAMIEQITAAIRAQNWGIGHLKFLARGEQGEAKISIPTLEEAGWQERMPSLRGRRIEVLINARVEAEAHALRELIQQSLEQTAQATGATLSESRVTFFHPDTPHPTHRISASSATLNAS